MEQISEIIIYQAADNEIRIQTRLYDETIWLKHANLCKLFSKSKSTISEHIKNIFKEGELIKNSLNIVLSMQKNEIKPMLSEVCYRWVNSRLEKPK